MSSDAGCRHARKACWRISVATLTAIALAGCSSGTPASHSPTTVGGASSSSLGSPVAPTTPTASPGTSVQVSDQGWCTAASLSAQAGPASPVYGNGEAVEVTVTQIGQTPCQLPSVVTVVLTDTAGATESSAQSSPASGPITLMAGGHARLRIDWVSQGCVAPSPPAGAGRIEWSTPTGTGSQVITGIGPDKIAPCHAAFGVSDLQPVS